MVPVACFLTFIIGFLHLLLSGHTYKKHWNIGFSFKTLVFGRSIRVSFLYICVCIYRHIYVCVYLYMFIRISQPSMLFLCPRTISASSDVPVPKKQLRERERESGLNNNRIRCGWIRCASFRRYKKKIVKSLERNPSKQKIDLNYFIYFSRI